MTTTPHRVRIKLGDAEFEAEGSEESVKQQYADFLAAMAARPAAVTPAPTQQQQQPAGQADGGGVGSEIINRVFKSDGDLISLQFKPSGDNTTPDALMLILYGYAVLKNQEQVLGTQLVRSAKQSGFNLARVDRSLSGYEGQSLVLRGGVKKGTHYSLNNPGKKKAEELLKALPL